MSPAHRSLDRLDHSRSESSSRTTSLPLLIISPYKSCKPKKIKILKTSPFSILRRHLRRATEKNKTDAKIALLAVPGQAMPFTVASPFRRRLCAIRKHRWIRDRLHSAVTTTATRAKRGGSPISTRSRMRTISSTEPDSAQQPPRFVLLDNYRRLPQ